MENKGRGGLGDSHMVVTRTDAICFPILLSNRRAVGTVSSKEMSINEGAGLLYCQSSIYSRMFSNLTCVDFFNLIFFFNFTLFNNRD